MDNMQIRIMQLGRQGYTCSQIIILMGLEQCAQKNSGLVRAMAGLAYGCGSGHGSCGVLTGGCCLLAWYAGHGGTDRIGPDRLMPMLQTLSEWFSHHTGCKSADMSCDAIVGQAGPAASRQRCGAMMAETFGKVMQILDANGIDPGMGGYG